MNITVAVQTFNPMSTMRWDLLERTLRSLELAVPFVARRIIFDNASTDGSFDTIDTIEGWEKHRREGANLNRTPGAGRNALLDLVMGRWTPSDGPQLVVMSDDDMEWRVGAQDKLLDFWTADNRPQDIAIVGGLLEPEYGWNKARYTVDVGGVRVLVRDSCPGAAWSFCFGSPVFRGIAEHHVQLETGKLWGRQTVFKDDFGYDYDYCQKLSSADLCVAQMDLAEHIGWDASTHGNRAIDGINVKPLDRDKWGV